MGKRFTLLLLAMAFLLSACQLAILEENRDSGFSVPETEDLIVGMLITFDRFTPNATPDPEALHLIPNQGKRIYAQLQEETVVRDDGAEHITHRMVFPENLGLTFMGYLISPKLVETMPEEDTYWTTTIDDGITMEKNSFHTVNEDSFVQLEAVIYVADTASDLVLYWNPVYQNEQGEVYALGVAPGGFHGTSMYDCSLSYSSNSVVKQNGEAVDEKQGYVKATIRSVSLPDHYRFIQMDADNQILKTEDILPADLPEEYYPEENCAYVILEEYNGGKAVKRSIRSADDSETALDVFYPMENGICHYRHTQVKGEGATCNGRF